MKHPGLRRILHACSSLFVLFVLLGSADILRLVLLVGVVLAVVGDVARIKIQTFGKMIARIVPVYREKEQTKLSGATWLAIGYLGASCFAPPACVCGILVGGLADPAASWIGSSYGKPTEKTWIGSAAAAVVALVALLLCGVSMPAVVAGTAAATLLERWSGSVNDNLLIAPGTALVVWLMI